MSAEAMTSPAVEPQTPRIRRAWAAMAVALVLVVTVGVVSLTVRASLTTAATPAAAAPLMASTAQATGTQVEITVTSNRPTMQPGDTLEVTVTIHNVSDKVFSSSRGCNFEHQIWVDFADSAVATADVSAQVAKAIDPENHALATIPSVFAFYMQVSTPCADKATLTELSPGASRTVLFSWNALVDDQPVPDGSMVVRALIGNDERTLDVPLVVTGSPFGVTTNQARNNAARNQQFAGWVSGLPAGTTFEPSHLELVRGQWMISATPKPMSSNGIAQPPAGPNTIVAWVDATTGEVTSIHPPPAPPVETSPGVPPSQR